MFAAHNERKLAKKQKKAEKQAKFEKWEEGWKEKQRKGDEKKVKKVKKQKAKEEAAKTSFEKNLPKYEIWSGDDRKGKMLMDKYNLHSTKKESPERTPSARPSSFIGSKNPTQLPFARK